jgi:hypothetical protein
MEAGSTNRYVLFQYQFYLNMALIVLPFALSGLPHTLTHDDIYEGMLIPAGSSVIPNHWYLAFHLLHV